MHCKRSKVTLALIVLLLVFVFSRIHFEAISFTATRSVQIQHTSETTGNGLQDHPSNGLLDESPQENMTYLSDISILWSHRRNMTNCPSPRLIPGLKNPCFVVKETDRCALHCLPYFYVPGVTKSGTSQIFADILLHPEVQDGKKEIRWFDYRTSKIKGNRTFNAYTKFFSTLSMTLVTCRNQFQESVKEVLSTTCSPFNMTWHLTPKHPKFTDFPCSPNISRKIIGDGSPRMIWNGNYNLFPSETEPGVAMIPRFIHNLNKNTKFVVMLREPISRLMSDFNHFKKTPYFYSNLSISNDMLHKQCVSAISWWNKCRSSGYSEFRCVYGYNFSDIGPPGDPKIYWNENFPAADRLRVSLYYFHVKEFLDVFPRENFLFIRTEDYKVRRVDILTKDVFNFLNLRPLKPDELDVVVNAYSSHLANKNANYVTGFTETIRILRDFYRPFNIRLAELLQDDKFLWNDVQF